MGKLIVMPKLGLTMTEGQLDRWHKIEGDSIEIGDIFFEVTTEKLTNEVESNAEGIVRKLFVEEGAVVECLKPVAIIAEADEDISALLQEALSSGGEIEREKVVESENQAVKANNPIKREGRVKISPAAKKFAKENNADIELIEGTGPEGRIVLEDIKRYLEDNKNNIKVSPVASKIAQELGINLKDVNKDGRIMKDDILSLNNSCISANGVDASERRVKMSSMRKVISARMSSSWNVSPTVTYDIKVDTSSLKRLREQVKDVCKITYTDLLVKIVSKVLIEYPLLNCSIDKDELVFRNYANIGIAVAIEEGLVVPVVKYVNEKGLNEISTEVKELARKAKNNELNPEDISGGTFTITNLGMFGIEYFSPIINQPEVAILGVNKITDTPVVENGEIVIKPLMNLSLTADHRAVDGSVAAEFLSKLKEYIEKPELLML